MKRITMLIAALALVLGGSLAAFAEHVTGSGGAGLEFNAKGSWRMELNFLNNVADFDADDDTDMTSDQKFNARVRARTWFEFIASENVKAVLGTEVGDVTFGSGAGNLGTDGVAIEVKHAYLNFKLPNTPVTVTGGLQGVAIPGNFGSLLLDDDVAGLLFSAPFNDMVSLTAGWIRINNNVTAASTWNGTVSSAEEADDWDIFPFILNVKSDMFGVQPYFVYANIGEDAVAGNDDPVSAYWLGVSAQIKPIENLAILADLIYGTTNLDENELESTGWGTVLGAAYTVNTGSVSLTPTVFGMYFTGEDDDDDNGSERMPDVAGNFALTNFGFAGSNFSTDSYLTAFNEGFGYDATQPNPANIGLWAVGFALKNVSFTPGLTHNFTFWYGQGTNDEDAADVLGDNLFTKEDNAYELTFDTTWKMYDQLSAIIEMGYLKADMDEDVGTRGEDYLDDAAWKTTVGFKYVF